VERNRRVRDERSSSRRLPHVRERWLQIREGVARRAPLLERGHGNSADDVGRCRQLFPRALGVWHRPEQGLRPESRHLKAREFARTHGCVFMATIPIAGILNATWKENAESEVLIANGAWATILRTARR
jgi:hypothetical protein